MEMSGPERQAPISVRVDAAGLRAVEQAPGATVLAIRPGFIDAGGGPMRG